MVYVIAIRLSHNGHLHEHITDVKRQDGTQINSCTRSAMIQWLQEGNHAFVTDGTRTVEVGVVNATTPYLRTYANGHWTDNLLALPRF